MTSQALIQRPSSEAANSQALLDKPSVNPAMSDASTVSTQDQKSIPLSCKLPYQANHQVELLHLQAEIDDLLHRLQTLKQSKDVELDIDN